MDVRIDRAKTLLSTAARQPAQCDKKHGWIKGAGKCVRVRSRSAGFSQNSSRIPFDKKTTIAVAAGTSASIALYLGARRIAESDFIGKALLDAENKVIDNIDEINHSDFGKKIEKSALPEGLKSNLLGLVGRTKAWASGLFIQKTMGGEFLSADPKTNSVLYRTDKGSLYSVGSVKDNVVAFYTEADPVDERNLGQPVFSMGFMINDEFSKTDISPDTGKKILVMVSSIFDSQIPHLPQDCLLHCVAADGDKSAASKKNIIYKRKGFVDVGGGSLWAVVKDGKVAKLSKEEVEALSRKIKERTPYNVKKDGSIYSTKRGVENMANYRVNEARALLSSVNLDGGCGKGKVGFRGKCIPAKRAFQAAAGLGGIAVGAYQSRGAIGRGIEHAGNAIERGARHTEGRFREEVGQAVNRRNQRIQEEAEVAKRLYNASSSRAKEAQAASDEGQRESIRGGYKLTSYANAVGGAVRGTANRIQQAGRLLASTQKQGKKPSVTEKDVDELSRHPGRKI